MKKKNNNLIKKIKKLNFKDKRILTLTIISILALLTLASTSLAVFLKNHETDQKDLFATGDLVVTFSDEGNSINLNPAKPLSDEYGSTLEPYTFTITNSGSYKATYEVKLVDSNNLTSDAIEKLKPFLKYQIDDNNPVYLKDTNNQILVSGRLSSRQIKTHNLRIWIAQEATQEIEKLSYSASISLNGKAINYKSLGPVESSALTLNNTTLGNRIENFKIYGNSVQNTTTSEIKSVGEPNLFDYNYVSYGQAWGSSDGALTTSANTVCNTNLISVTPGENLNIYADGDVSNINSRFVFYKDGVFVKSYRSDEIKAVPSGVNQVRINVYVNNGASPDTVKNIRLVTSNYDSDSIVNYYVPITIGKKNLFSTGSVFDYTGSGLYHIRVDKDAVYNVYYSSGNASHFYNKKLYEPGQYTIQGTFTDGKRFLLRFYDAEGNVISNINPIGVSATYNSFYKGFMINSANFTVTIPDTVYYWQLGFTYVGAQYSSGSVSNIQVEKGATKTEYETFNGETYYIYLDEPLKSVENVRDYIDYEQGKLIRYISQDGNVLSTPIEETITLPQISALDGVTMLSVDTSVKPTLDGRY